MNVGYASVILTFVISVKSHGGEEQCSVEDCVGSSVAALVPARAGSKGIKNKNLSRIGNETLVARSLRIIHESEQFDSVWVSTDGKGIADEALSHGAEVHWRDPTTATDNATTVSAVQDFLRFHKDFDIIAVVQCTSPFLRPKFLSSAFRKMIAENLDCIFSATRVFNLRWTEDEDGFVKPVNFDSGKRPRRQDWNGELIENGMFYFARRELVMQYGLLQNDRCGVLEVPKKFSLEIDAENDLLIARLMLKFIDNESVE